MPIEELHPDFWDIFQKAYCTLIDLRASESTCKTFISGSSTCNGCHLNRDSDCILHRGYQPYKEFLKTFDQEAFEFKYPELLI